MLSHHTHDVASLKAQRAAANSASASTRATASFLHRLRRLARGTVSSSTSSGCLAGVKFASAAFGNIWSFERLADEVGYHLVVRKG